MVVVMRRLGLYQSAFRIYHAISDQFGSIEYPVFY
jgi:hypothetical protein